jgi:ATP-dependent DNA helicase Q1
LSIIKHQFPDVPILGLTATATARVLEDVKEILGIPKCIVFKASFNRENLVYEVKPKPSNGKDCMEELKLMISRRFPGQSGESNTDKFNYRYNMHSFRYCVLLIKESGRAGSF